jgi:hypothetical protein
MLVCAAMVAFALGPDSIKTLRAAQNEASFLGNTRWDGYQGFLRGKLESDNRTQTQALTKIMQRLQVRFASDISLADEPFYCDSPQPRASSLAEVERFFRDDSHWVQSIQLRTPDATIEKEMKARLLPLPRNQYISQLRFVPLDADLTRCGPYDEVHKYTRLRIDFAVSSDDGSPSYIKNIEVFLEPRDARSSGPYAMEWLRTLPETEKFVSDSELFPALKLYWGDVAKDDPHTAMQKLEEREASARSKLAFLGLAVDRAAAGWVSPVTLLLLLIFFISHLRHARQAKVDRKDFEEASSYPWVGAFKDAVGTVLAYTSISGLPIASLAWMLVRSQEGLLHQPWYAILFAAAVLIVSAWAGWELKLFRSVILTAPREVSGSDNSLFE